MEKCFDQDVLTNGRLFNDEVYVLDFGKPVKIAKVTCVPRGDGNDIYPGNTYELLYYDLHGWQSVGMQTATDYVVEFDGVPAGALYWLRNLTGGVEERIFTEEDGGILFW